MLILSSLEKALKSNKVNNEKLKENGVFVYCCGKKFTLITFWVNFPAIFDTHIELLSFDSSIKFCDFLYP
jgi:hypothetical protein